MPSGGALFGNAASRSQNKNLVEFKAGKMNLKGKMVYPDTRKGLVYIHQSEDSLMHFCWKDRQTLAVEDDLIIFPDDCEFKKVAQCTTGRAYILKFKSSNRKFFFWLQESKTEKDEDLCRRVNEVLNNPPAPGRSGGGTPDGDLQNLLNNMSQQQLMQLFGGVGQIGGLSSLLGTMNRPSGQSTRTSSATSVAITAVTTASSTTTSSIVTSPSQTTTTTTSTPSQQKTSSTTKPSTGSQKPPIQLRDLQNFLSGLTAPPSERIPVTPQQNVDLSSSLNTENLQTVLNDPNFANTLQQHLPSLSVEPETTPTEQLRSTLTSPQFQQAVSMFSAALQSGQLGPVVQQFEVGPEAVTAAQQGNMEEFVKALEKANISKDNEKSDESENSEKPKKPEDKKGGDDDEMALD